MGPKEIPAGVERLEACSLKCFPTQILVHFLDLRRFQQFLAQDRVDSGKRDARIENRKTLGILDVHEGRKNGRDFFWSPSAHRIVLPNLSNEITVGFWFLLSTESISENWMPESKIGKHLEFWTSMKVSKPGGIFSGAPQLGE